MGKAVFNRTTARLKEWVRFGEIAHNPTTEVVLEVGSCPNQESDRWDGATGVRQATDAEKFAAAAERRERLAAERFADPIVQSILEAIAARFSVPVADFKSEVLEKLRAKL